MTQHDGRRAEAHAIALLQQIAVMCEETRRVASGDPMRIQMMLDTFEETLAALAPVLEGMGQFPADALGNVIQAANHARDQHQALLDSMALELDRLSRAIAESDHAAHGSAAYASAMGGAATAGFETRA